MRRKKKRTEGRSEIKCRTKRDNSLLLCVGVCLCVFVGGELKTELNQFV